SPDGGCSAAIRATRSSAPADQSPRPSPSQGASVSTSCGALVLNVLSAKQLPSAETSSSEPTARSASRESSTTLPTTRLPRGFQISGLGSDAGSASSSSRVSSQGRSSSSGGGMSSLGSSSGNGTRP